MLLLLSSTFFAVDFFDLDLACSKDVRICPDLIQGRKHDRNIRRTRKKIEHIYSEIRQHTQVHNKIKLEINIGRVYSNGLRNSNTLTLSL